MIPYAQDPPYYSQWGEDQWIAEHCRLPEDGVFVDVGAGDGIRGSNTLYFENLGWRGLCVDADPRNHPLLPRNRRCLIDTRAIATTPGPRAFGCFTPRSSRSGLGLRGPEYTQIQVDCVPLKRLLAQAGISTIDLLSIDVEGNELDVWRSFSPRRHQPRIVIIEYDDDHPARTAAVICAELGAAYRLAYRTPANVILRRAES